MKNSEFRKAALMFLHSAFFILNWLAQPAGAQPARGGVAEVDPIRCWWRTSGGAVAVGQPFSVVLTCAVLDNDSVRVVADQSPLAVGTVQLAPFELVGGTHPADLRSGPRRFFQYEYSVRLIDPGVIGRDVKLPAMAIHYRVESNVQAQALEGRDRTYLLPPEAVHVISMVPAEAADIRDASDAPFGAIEALRFRARLFDIVAIALAVLGVIVIVPALIGLLIGRRQHATEHEAVVSDRAVLDGVVSELSAVQAEARSGWTPNLLARALTAARIAAAYALGRPPRQRVVAAGADVPDARLVVTTGLTRKQRTAVSSATTTDDLGRGMERLPPDTSHAERGRLDGLRESIASLTAALYAREAIAGNAPDDAVQSVLTVARDLRRQHGRLRAWFRRDRGRLTRRG